MYTIRNHSLESITCDNNGAYGCSDGNKKAFYVNISGTNVSAKTVHLKMEDMYTKRKREGNCDERKKDFRDIF